MSFASKKERIENEEKIYSDEKNKVLIENALMSFPFSSVREIAKMTHIPKSTVFNVLTEQLHYENKRLKWVPHFLNSSQLSERVSSSKELLKLLKISRKDNYKFFYTGDESWFYLTTDYNQQWLPHEKKNHKLESKN